jgi:hypothetical protein
MGSPPSGTPAPRNASTNMDILSFICPWPNDQRSHAGPMTPDMHQDRLLALAGATG